MPERTAHITEHTMDERTPPRACDGTEQLSLTPKSHTQWMREQCRCPPNLFDASGSMSDQQKMLNKKDCTGVNRSFAVALCSVSDGPDKNALSRHRGGMRLKTLDLVLAACPPGWRGRAFLSLGEKNKKWSKNHAGVTRENLRWVWP